MIAKTLYIDRQHFVVVSHGRNRFGLREALEKYAGEQWMPPHVSPQRKAELVLDHFQRAVFQELMLLDIECIED